ncbi:MAG: FGGY-family carbohydrate kinase [Clostridiales bacterium]|nr:FGGY-family carbohydrate kinase [Clostridiales bacterium]
MYILALEASTTSAKAVLYDSTDASMQLRTKAFRPPGADISLHDADSDWQDLLRLGRELAEGKDISAITLSCAWHSLLLCDKDMQPMSPVYLWTNTEASDVCAALRQDAGYTKAFYQKTGCMVNAIYPFFKLRMLAERGCDLSAFRIMGQGTYHTWRLTGQWAVTDAVASGSGLLNIHTKAYDPALLEELGIQEAQLGRLISYRDVLRLNEEGAKSLGLRPGIPVLASMPDGALNQVGADAMDEGVMSLSAGTSGALRFAASRPVLPDDPGVWCYLGPDSWLSGAATSGCCNCVDWFIARICGGHVAYAELEKEAAEAEGDTPVFLPFLFGERCPGWNDLRRGGFFGLKPSHARGDLYRAVLEGVLFNLYQCFEILADLNGAPSGIRLSGGITNSPFWMQMCADIFQHNLEVDGTAHASMIGSLILACRALGLPEDRRRTSAGSGRLIIPNPDAAGYYREKYARYLACYQATR